MIKVIKRNGTVVPFDKEKIILAVTKAYFGEETPWYTNPIVRKIHNFAKKNGNYIDVEEIQNIDTANIVDMPAIAKGEGVEYFEKIAKVNNQLIIMINPHKLLSETEAGNVEMLAETSAK